MESGPSVPGLHRMSSKNVSKTKSLPVFFSNRPQWVKFLISFRGSVLPPHLGCVAGIPHRCQGGGVIGVSQGTAVAGRPDVC